MGDKATLRLARQELEDLYLGLGVPDDSVDLTFRDFAFKPPPPTVVAASSSGKALPALATTTTTTSNLPNSASADHDDADGGERNKKQTTTAGGSALARSTTNIFTYRPLEEDHQPDVAGRRGGSGLAAGAAGGGGRLLQLPPLPASPLPGHLPLSDDDDEDDYADHQQYHHYPAPPPPAGTSTTTSSKSAAAAAAAAAGGSRRSRKSHVADDAVGAGRERRAAARSNHSYRRPGIPHSNICALCNHYVYVFRHRCLVCGRVYCRRCVGAGMGDMTEGRKCIDCLGRRYSHRYIHRAGDTGRCGFCFWGDAKAVTAQELIWAEKGPAPRRRSRPNGGAYSISASYGGGDGGYYSSTNTVASASMSMTMNSDNSIAMMKMNGGHHGRNISGMPASASSSFVAAFPHNPHALPL